MIYKTLDSFQRQLLTLPETGMGYQVISAKKTGRFLTENFIVYNSELIVELDSQFDYYKNQIINEGYARILDKSNSLSVESISLFKKIDIQEVRVVNEFFMNTRKRKTGGTGAAQNSPVYANGTDIFVRLSAFPDDKRIDLQNKCLLAGSYTTTFEDYSNCKMYNDNPVDRYALPNDEPIKWAYFIQPTTNDKLRPGIVQPAYNHLGGGVEALFDNGTSKGTYKHKDKY